MAGEALHSSLDQNTGLDTHRETTEEILSRLDDEAIANLAESGTVEDVRAVIEMLMEDDPELRPYLIEFQENNSRALAVELQRAAANDNGEVDTQRETSEVPSDVIDYFSLNEETIAELQEQLGEVDLDIFTLLGGLKEHIENKLDGLSEEHKEKIRTSIGRRTRNISDLVFEMKEGSSSPEDFRNGRWILDEKIGDAFNFYTAELFPTLELKLALARGEQAPSTYTERYEERMHHSGMTYEAYNPNYVDIESYMEEIDELLDAEVDSDGNFDEGFFSTQRLMQRSNETHSALFDDMGIHTAENISLLSETDKQIQQRAMIAYFILIGVQMIPYLGAPISLGVDGVDAFSSHDGTLELGKSLGMINQDFQMEKQWYDNALGGIGLALTAVGLQGIAKGKKLTDSFASLEKIGFGKVEEMLQEFGNTLGISQERLQSISDYLRSLFRGDLDEASNGGRGDEVVESINSFSPEELARLERGESPEVLGRTLNDIEKQAIIEAHNIGERLEDGTYSLGDLREKVRILQEAEFDSSDIRVLFDKNICGTEYPKFASLYEDPRYSFLSEYRDVLGDISDKDIIGEGNNAIVLRNLESGETVFKVAKPNSSHILRDEYENHDEFVNFLDAFRNSDVITEKERGALEGFYIPKILRLKDGVYEMERVEGVSFKSLIHIDYHRDNFNNVPTNLYDGVSQNTLLKFFEGNGVSPEELEAFKSNGINDSQIMDFMRERGLGVYPAERAPRLDWEQPHVKELANMWINNTVKQDRIDDFYHLLWKHGYQHGDKHWGNFLVTEDSSIFMIDFGLSEITYNRTIIE